MNYLTWAESCPEC